MKHLTIRWLVITNSTAGNHSHSFRSRKNALSFARVLRQSGQDARVIDLITGERVYGRIRRPRTALLKHAA
jgi:hypothetical protein